MDGRGDSAEAGRVLGKGVGGSAIVIGIANGPSAAGGAGVFRGMGEDGAGCRTQQRVEGVESEAWDDAVYDFAGGVGHAAGAAVRAGRPGDRDAGGQSWSDGDREP